MNKKQILITLIYPIVALVLFVTIWTLCALAYSKPLILPYFWEVLAELWKLLSQGSFYLALLATTARTLIGFLLATIIAWVLAQFAADNVHVRKVLDPIVTVLRALPTMSVILLALIWFRSGILPVFVAFLVAFPLLYGAFVMRLTQDNADILEMCAVFKVPCRVRMFKLYPSILLSTLMRITDSILPLTLKVIVAGEVLANTVNSVGVNMQNARLNVETANLLAWTVACVVLCFVLQALVALVRYILRRTNVCPQ